MSNKILFVFEGLNTEEKVADSYYNCFYHEDMIIKSVYGTTIYNLYNKISKDKDLDTFTLLKEIPHNKEVLESYNRGDFAEIYLFFDYDGHSTSANDEKLKEILELFNEETGFGKLFINYPMIESLKHYSKLIDFKGLKIDAKKDIRYKHIVSINGDEIYRHFHLYTQEQWICLIGVHLKKMNYVVSDSYDFPTNNHTQSEIFFNQLEKYIEIDSTIAVLSSFPIFLFDYYGHDYIVELLS